MAACRSREAERNTVLATRHSITQEESLKRRRTQCRAIHAALTLSFIYIRLVTQNGLLISRQNGPKTSKWKAVRWERAKPHKGNRPASQLWFHLAYFVAKHLESDTLFLRRLLFIQLACSVYLPDVTAGIASTALHNALRRSAWLVGLITKVFF